MGDGVSDHVEDEFRSYLQCGMPLKLPEEWDEAGSGGQDEKAWKLPARGGSARLSSGGLFSLGRDQWLDLPDQARKIPVDGVPHDVQIHIVVVVDHQIPHGYHLLPGYPGVG